MKTYNQIIKEQERRGFVERVSSSSQLRNGQTHYVKHHHVRKESSTTPIRIVYDCSCQMSENYPSLNDCLEVGPPLINDLCSILIYFYVHKYGVVTDIEKAFFMSSFIMMIRTLSSLCGYQTHRIRRVSLKYIASK